MNEKLNQCVGLVELLRDHLKDKHHTRLELMIIILIMIEVSNRMILFLYAADTEIAIFRFCYSAQSS